MTEKISGTQSENVEFSYPKERKSKCLGQHIFCTYAIWMFVPFFVIYFAIFFSSRSRDAAMERAIRELRDELNKEVELNAEMSRKIAEDLKTLKSNADELWKVFGHRTLEVNEQMSKMEHISTQFSGISQNLSKSKVELKRGFADLRKQTMRHDYESEEAFEQRMMPNLAAAVHEIDVESAKIQPDTVGDMLQRVEKMLNSENLYTQELKNVENRYQVAANAERAALRSELTAIEEEKLA